MFAHILTARANFDKAKNVEEMTESEANNDTSVADAFRSPPASVTKEKLDGLRISIQRDQPLRVNQIRPRGWTAFWAVFFPSATVLELSGRFHTVLSIYPTHVQLETRRWPSKMGFLPNYEVSIPVYDEIGDSPTHHLHVQSALAFLYPFVPMHVQVTLDEGVAFGQGKFEI